MVSTDGTAAPGHAKRLQLAPPGRLDGLYGVMDDRRAHTHSAAGAVAPGLLGALRGAGLGRVSDERTGPGVPGVREGVRPGIGTAWSATGTGRPTEACLLGRDRVPAPPDSTRAFICATLARIRKNGPWQGGDLGVVRGGLSVLAAEDVVLARVRRGGSDPVLHRGQAGPQVSLAVQAAGPGPARLGPACERLVNGLRGHGGSPSFHAALRVPRGPRDKRTGKSAPSSARTHIRRGTGAPELDGRSNRSAQFRCWAVPR